MRLVPALSIAVAVAVAVFAASAATAQDARQTDDGPVRTAPSAAAPATTPVPDEAAVEAAAATFETRMDEMAKELETAKIVSGADPAALKTATNAIVARYQPGADAFAEMVAALIASRPVAPEDGVRAREAVQQIRDMPGLIRDHHLAAPSVAPATTPPAP